MCAGMRGSSAGLWGIVGASRVCGVEDGLAPRPDLVGAAVVASAGVWRPTQGGVHLRDASERVFAVYEHLF